MEIKKICSVFIEYFYKLDGSSTSYESNEVFISKNTETIRASINDIKNIDRKNYQIVISNHDQLYKIKSDLFQDSETEYLCELVDIKENEITIKSEDDFEIIKITMYA